jgi:hypothetical protein
MNKNTIISLPVAFVALAFAVAWVPMSELPKRLAPQEISPVVFEGVRYEAPHFDTDCDQNGGCIVAYNDANGKQMWYLKVYCTQYIPDLETDVQDVFITALRVENEQLVVENERGLRFIIDPETRSVSGDATGCSEPDAGCGQFCLKDADTSDSRPEASAPSTITHTKSACGCGDSADSCSVTIAGRATSRVRAPLWIVCGSLLLVATTRRAAKRKYRARD